MGRAAKINFLEEMCIQIYGPAVGQSHWDLLLCILNSMYTNYCM